MKGTILIVDDEKDIRDSLCEYLQTYDLICHVAISAEEALRLLNDQDIDLVITDIKMPGMGGLELTRIIKSRYDADVMIMTGFCNDYTYEEAILTGASDFILKPLYFEEILLRIKRVLRERTLKIERAAIMDQLRTLAITDDLTRLYNQRHFYAQLEKEVLRCQRYDSPLTLLLMDIDHFKAYNDTWGHLEGDQVLIRLGRIINAGLRKVDSGFRFGGEEFTIILPETSLAEAHSVATRIQQAIAKEVFHPVPEADVIVTISVGVTDYRKGEPIRSLIRRADTAMYQSKANGRNTITVVGSDANEAVDDALCLPTNS
jgi:two-component system, cell cycle response regulator